MTQAEQGELNNRVNQLSRMGASIDKAVRNLNAEFAACFYANKKTLWVSFMDAGRMQYKALGAFA